MSLAPGEDDGPPPPGDGGGGYPGGAHRRRQEAVGAVLAAKATTAPPVTAQLANLLGALVLATMADWFFLAHQTMTDMPFVAAMTGAGVMPPGRTVSLIAGRVRV